MSHRLRLSVVTRMLGLGSPRTPVHPGLSAEVSGLTRLYSPMADLVSVSLLFLLARVVSREDKRNRAIFICLAAFLILAVALQFARAKRFSSAVAAFGF